MTTRTVDVSGVLKVDFNESGNSPYFYLSEGFIWIKNTSDGTVFASVSEDVSPGADGTTEILSGAAGRLRMTQDNCVYLLADGTVEVATTATSASPFVTSGSGGGGGGTSDYTALSNKPRINGVTLIGNKSFDDLGLEWVSPDVVADEFDDTKTYSENDFVMYNGKLYQFTSDHSGSWDIGDVRIVTIIDAINSGEIPGISLVDHPTAEEISESAAKIWG